MTIEQDGFKTRHVFGPRAMSAVLPSVVRPIYRKRAPATAEVLLAWPDIVGPAIAAVTTPRKLFQGTLSIACSGPVALELQHLTPYLIGRINTHLGQTAVSRLRFVQDLASHAAPPPPRPAPATDAAERAVADLPSGPVRDALRDLGAQVMSTGPGRRR